MRQFHLITCIILLISTQFSCKEKKCDHQHPEGQVQANLDTPHKHYYGVYTGRIENSSLSRTPDGNVVYVKYMNEETHYINNEINRNYFKYDTDTIKAYKVKGNNIDNYRIIPKNYSCLNNRGVRDTTSEFVNNKAAKGVLGCIPRFEAGITGHVLASSSGNIYTVTIYVAEHENIGANDIVEFLTLDTFIMTQADYMFLDSLFQVNPNIEGGLEPINGDPNDRLLIVYDNNQPVRAIIEQ